MIGLIGLYLSIDGQSSKLTVYYKQEVISPIISSLCEQAVYHPKGDITEEMFCLSGLFELRPNRYHSEDLIAGQIGKTNFFYSEILAEEKRIVYTKEGKKEQ